MNDPSSILAAQEQRAILQLVVNQVEKGEILVLIREGDLLARVSDLERAGLRAFSGKRETIRGEDYVSLPSLAPAVTFEMEEKALALQLTAQPALLGTTVLDLQQGRPPGIFYAQDTSAFFNYAVNGIDFKGYETFGEAGLSIKGGLLFSSFSRNTDGAIVRGLTNLTLDDRPRLMRWVAGDRFASSRGLGGSLFLAGISASREFSLDPYFFSYPTLRLSDALATPSAVDIYVNNLLVRREQLPPGRFELKNLPAPSGSGFTRVVIRDAFGREREVVSPFYLTTGVLTRGLHEYSYHLGTRRNNIGTENWDYGPLTFLGFHRVGLTDALTAGLRLEAATGLASGGTTATVRLPFGTAELSLAGSRENGLQGGAAALAYNYLGRVYNFGGAIRALSPHYANVSLKALDERPWLETSAFVGFQVAPRTSLVFQYTLANSQANGKTHQFALSTNIRLTDRLNLFLINRHSRQAEDRVNEGFVGLSYFFGHTTATLSYQRFGSTDTGTGELQKSLPLGSGFGYRLQGITTEEQSRARGILQYQGPYGRYEASYDRADREDTTILGVSGALVAIGRGIYLTRPLQDGFALIRVPGAAGVRVYASNQEVGYTNSNGNLLVPNLLSYYGNPLGIADEDISLDYRVDARERTIAPPYRGGAVVTFPVERIQTLTGTMLLESSGQVTIPAYGQLTVTVGEKRFESPIGRQGEFYLENVPAGEHPAVLEYEATVCRFTLEVPSSGPQAIPLGTLRCVLP